MGKFIITEEEKNRIKSLYEQKFDMSLPSEDRGPKFQAPRLNSLQEVLRIKGFLPIDVDKNKYNFWFQYKDKGPDKPGDILGNIVQKAGSNNWDIFVNIGRFVSDGMSNGVFNTDPKKFNQYNTKIKNEIESMGNGAKWQLTEQNKLYKIEILGITDQEKIKQIATKITEFNTQMK